MSSTFQSFEQSTKSQSDASSGGLPPAGAWLPPASRINLALNAAWQIGALAQAIHKQVAGQEGRLLEESLSARISLLVDSVCAALDDEVQEEAAIHYAVHGFYPPRAAGGAR